MINQKYKTHLRIIILRQTPPLHCVFLDRVTVLRVHIHIERLQSQHGTDCTQRVVILIVRQVLIRRQVGRYIGYVGGLVDYGK